MQPGLIFMKRVVIIITRTRLFVSAVITIPLIIILAIILTYPSDKLILGGRVIIIDAGHGGVDGGANNQYIIEKDVNLDVALKLQEKLEMAGSRVVMTRTEDVSLSNSQEINRSRYLEDLNERVRIINSSGASILVSIHTNVNNAKPSTRGMIAFYSDTHPGSKELAYTLQDIFNSSEFIYNNTIYKSKHAPQMGRYFILTKSNIPGVIVETGFISNSTDLFLLRQQEYRKHIADTIYKGIMSYFQSPRKYDNKTWGIDENNEEIYLEFP